MLNKERWSKMTTLEIMINAYENLSLENKAYADKHLPTFDEQYDYYLNHWTNEDKDSDWAMSLTIDTFIMWFNGLANDTYGLRD